MSPACLIFIAIWNSEPSAGIRAGYEKVTIIFEHTASIDTDTLEYWRESVRDFYDGAKVYTRGEWEQFLLEDEKAEERRRGS